MRRIILTTSVLALAGLSAWAQEDPTKFERRIEVIAPHGETAVALPANNVSFISSEMSWELSTVKGAPYSAEALSETTQTLSDGNRISRKNKSLLYRDSEGRTRREQTLDAMGPWSSAEPARTVFINDPVAGVNYVLDVNNKIARKHEAPNVDVLKWKTDGATGEARTFNVEVHGGMVAAGVPSAGHRVEIRRSTTATSTTTTQDGREADVTVAAPPMPPIPGVPMVLPRIQMMKEGLNDSVKREDLGTRIIEGVEAKGTRTTVTMPAGMIGNERPIETVTERWYSDELKALVYSKQSDPRTGETVYRLTNLRRDEPTPALFAPPSDYKVEEMPKPDIHIQRLDGMPKQEIIIERRKRDQQ